MRKRLHSLFLLTMFSILCTLSVVAQITTSSMNGKIVSNGESIIGATVVALHEPSGTTYGTVTDMDGHFDMQGMRTGGPYTVTISYVGYQSAVYNKLYLQLGETFTLDAELKESSEALDEVVVTAIRTKFGNEKTGASTNISTKQITKLPTVNRSVSDIARLSPYASGMSMAGSNGRSTNFTIDGANFNNNFGLSSDLPGGGNPVSMDAIEEVQVVIAPFDVRQSNFIGGGINAITKSGTNTFKGTAYTYYRNQDMRGNRINGEDLGARADESKTTYGFTLGGPIIKNKLFFFANFEHEKTPGEVIKYRATGSGQSGLVSRTLASDLEAVSKHLKEKYGYDTGSYTDFPADESNTKLLARVDWNITDNHHLSVRYNNTKNTAWNAPNGNSSDTGNRLYGTYRVGPQSMSYANSLYSVDNKVQSWSVDLNSHFNEKISNQVLFTYTDIQDVRGSNSSPFPFIDIMYTDENGVNQLEPYISAGYELFTWNNGVKNRIANVTDNFTWNLNNHKITAGLSYEHQYANNAYMRNGTGYYRYASVDDFLNDRTPESFAITYGFNGEKNPNAQVTFNQVSFYAQDAWNIVKNFKLTYGVRLDYLAFDNSDLERNDAIYALDFGGQHIDTGKWPASRVQVSPRLGFNWDIFGDKSWRLRGGSGVFTGRLPLVFFTNMPTNANMVQNSVQFKTTYKNGVATGYDSRLDQFNGGMITDVDQMISQLGLPTTNTNHTASSKISGVAENFKMPQIWKSSIALDYQLPTEFPFTASTEFIYNKNINAVTITNINIKDPSNWERFNGADNRLIYPSDYQYVKGTNAVVLDNTSKGYGYTANITLTAQPMDNLYAMAAYTHTESKEVSGLPGSDPVSTWTGLNTIDGPNFALCQRSQYVVPDKVIASVNWTIPFQYKGLARNTNLSLYYAGYSPYGYSYMYTNDMNGDGNNNDLMYIPKDDSEIKFKTDADRVAFWNYVEQDGYLKSHKGQYAEAYAARAPWVHQFDFRISEDFEFKIGKTKHCIEVSLDIMNIGNLLNSKWGVPKRNFLSDSSSSRILKYEGRDESNTPIFSMYKQDGEYVSQSYDYYKDYSQCWKMQLGIRYVFN